MKLICWLGISIVSEVSIRDSTSLQGLLSLERNQQSPHLRTATEHKAAAR